MKKISFETFCSTMTHAIDLGGLVEIYDSFISLMADNFKKAVFSKFESTEDYQMLARLTLEKNDLKGINHDLVFNAGKDKEVYGWRILLGITGISHEFYKNMINGGKSISQIKILYDDEYTNKFIDIITSGHQNEDIKKQLQNTPIELKKLNLTKKKILLFTKEKVILKRIVEDIYGGRLGNKKGIYVENEIIGKVLRDLKVPWDKGKVEFLSKYYKRHDDSYRNPTIDIIIPNSEKPKILLESSYAITTSSLFTKKPDANDSLYVAVRNYNDANPGNEITFINFIDGGGWIARGTKEDGDLYRFWNSCDYAINYNNLNHLKEIIKKKLAKSDYLITIDDYFK